MRDFESRIIGIEIASMLDEMAHKAIHDAALFARREGHHLRNVHRVAYTMWVGPRHPERCTFKWWKRIVWDKQKIGMGYHYRSRHEFIVFLEKGKRKLNDLGIPDVLSFPRIMNGYPTEKPVELSAVLVNQSSRPGDLVLDPFFGSGSTAEACRLQGRDFIGFDISRTAFEYACSRLGLSDRIVDGETLEASAIVAP